MVVSYVIVNITLQVMNVNDAMIFIMIDHGLEQLNVMQMNVSVSDFVLIIFQWPMERQTRERDMNYIGEVHSSL